MATHTSGLPPEALIARIPLVAAYTSVSPSQLRLEGATGNGVKVIGAPPLRAIFFRLRSLNIQNASHCPSGENTGLRAPAVPGMGDDCVPDVA